MLPWVHIGTDAVFWCSLIFIPAVWGCHYVRLSEAGQVTFGQFFHIRLQFGCDDCSSPPFSKWTQTLCLCVCSIARPELLLGFSSIVQSVRIWEKFAFQLILAHLRMWHFFAQNSKWHNIMYSLIVLTIIYSCPCYLCSLDVSMIGRDLFDHYNADGLVWKQHRCHFGLLKCMGPIEISRTSECLD